MSIYLDASLCVPFFVKESSSQAVAAFLTSRPDLSISDFAVAEVSSAFSRLVRMETLSKRQAVERLKLFDEWRTQSLAEVKLTSEDVTEASGLVRRFELKLRTPDAIHLAVCRRLNLAMATLDGDLATVAKSLSIELGFRGLA